MIARSLMHRLGAVSHQAHLVAEAAQHGLDHGLVHRIVLHQQHVLAGSRVLPVGLVGQRFRAPGAEWQGDLQGEDRPRAFMALGTQGAAHAFGQGARDGQPEAGAAVAA
ncbi:hypothetical protein D3C84_853770 [compost metagenome]